MVHLSSKLLHLYLFMNMIHNIYENNDKNFKVNFSSKQFKNSKNNKLKSEHLRYQIIKIKTLKVKANKSKIYLKSLNQNSSENQSISIFLTIIHVCTIIRLMK